VGGLDISVTECSKADQTAERDHIGVTQNAPLEDARTLGKLRGGCAVGCIPTQTEARGKHIDRKGEYVMQPHFLCAFAAANKRPRLDHTVDGSEAEMDGHCALASALVVDEGFMLGNHSAPTLQLVPKEA
jgi:hypothetical protein